MPIRYQKMIYRTDLQANPKTYYVFGDNVQRLGFGGQAKEMRNEPNAVGIATKRLPSMNEGAFFSDDSADDLFRMMMGVVCVEQLLAEGRDVVVPSDGLGTGLSNLPNCAPTLYRLLRHYFAHFSERHGGEPCPWPEAKTE